MISIDKKDRPWGRFYVLHDEREYKLKRIEIDPGQRISYQYHNERSEVWTIVNGIGTVCIDGVVKDYIYGETILIARGAKHRIENRTKEKLVFIEVQTGKYFGEDDVIRLKDDYNRI